MADGANTPRGIGADVSALVGRVLSGRYRVVRPIGSGGMSDIFEALDLDNEEMRVAIKLMRATNPKALVRLKREYRRMDRLQHRNLVRYFSLEEHAGRPFIAMELIRGAEFYNALVRGGSSRLIERLRGFVQQLALGVMYLHHAGRVHRDLKGSNVMTDRDGRLVILDFGLVDDVERRTSITGSFGGVVGTMMYMSPEQASGHLSLPPSDWYAVGVMLYRALAGSYPFPGNNPFAVLNAKMRGVAPRVRTVSPWVPVALDELIARLLHREPGSRASGQDILAWCSMGVSGRRGIAGKVPPPVPPPQLIGRGAESNLLTATLQRFVTHPQFTKVMISGPAGVGKSALLRKFLSPLQRDKRFVVIKGYCYESDNVAFNAVDHLIERLGHFLRQQPDEVRDALLGENFRALTDVFPTLRQVSRAFAGSGLVQALGLEVEASPSERRSQAFAALRGLLHRIAAGRRFVLAIEDLHWVDLDSAQQLNSVLRVAGAPPLMFLGTYRYEHSTDSPVLQALERSGFATNGIHVCLDSLSGSDAVELARRMLKHPVASAEARRIARDSSGNPLLIEAMAQSPIGLPDQSRPAHSGRFLEHLVEHNLGLVSRDARALVEVVAAAGRPLRVDIAGAVAGVDVKDLLAQLRASRLIRAVTFRRGLCLEAFDERVSEVVRRGLNERDAQQIHLRIAQARLTLADDDGDDESLAYHWYRGGRLDKAREAATTAAQRLLRGGVTDSAIRLLKLARTCSPDDPALRRRLIETLIEGGKSGEAAPLLLEAAQDATSPLQRRQLYMEAGVHFMHAGHFAWGLRAFEPLFRGLGVVYPTSERDASERLDTSLTQLIRRGIAWKEHCSDKLAERHAFLWTLAKGLMFHDPVRGGFYAVKSALLALEMGDATRICRSLALAGVVAVERGYPEGLTWLEVVEAKAEAMSERSELGLVSICSGWAYLLQGDLIRAHELLDYGLHLIPANANFDQSVGARALFDTLMKLGEVGELASQSQAYAQQARERGDIGLYRTALLASVWPALAQDLPKRARKVLTEVAEIEVELTSTPDFRFATAELDDALYCGEPGRGWLGISTWWYEFERSNLPLLPSFRQRALALRARAALACWADPGAGNANVWRIAEQDIAFLVDSHAPGAHMLIASHAALRGDRTAAVRALEQAVAEYDSASMALHATMCRYAVALAYGTDVNSAKNFLQLQGVARPELWLDLAAPGLRQSLGR